jgi:hypothetical protein
VRISDREFSYFDDAYRALKGWNFSFILAPDHTIVGVERIEENLARSPGLQPKAVAMLRERFNALSLRRGYALWHSGLPDRAVRINDTWSRNDWIDPWITDLPILLKRRYRYIGTSQKDGNTLDRISFAVFSVEARSDPERKQRRKITNSSLHVASSGGQILFDRAVGRVVSRTEKTRFLGKLTELREDRDRVTFVDCALETATSIEKL